jgi:hypothetical protein
MAPWLSSLSSATTKAAPSEPNRYLVAKGLPTVRMKLVEWIWNLEIVEMEDLLQALHT